MLVITDIAAELLAGTAVDLLLRASMRSDVMHDAASFSSFTHDRNFGVIAAKQVNILLTPFEGKALIVKSDI